MSRDEGSIELRKVWVGTAGNVTVSIDQGDTNIDSAVADGENASTDANTVDTGDYSVSETFTLAGSADDYASELRVLQRQRRGHRRRGRRRHQER